MELDKLISEAISCLKNSILSKSDEMPEVMRLALTKIEIFIKEKLLPGNTKAIATFEEFVKNPEDPSLKAKLEVRIEDTLVKNELKAELENIVSEISNTETRYITLQAKLETLLDELETINKDYSEFDINIAGSVNELKKIKETLGNQILTSMPEEEIIEEDDEQDEEQDEKAIEKTEVKKKHEEEGEGKDTIIVPHDYSLVADYALQHAVQFAEIINGSICLVHVVKKAKDTETAKEKLEEIAQKTFNKYKIKPFYVIREGSIFSAITDVAIDIDAKMAIMGTHGVKGVQKITGSYALKVIADSPIPFIVVQAPPERDRIRNVVFPIDQRKGIKQKLTQAKYLSKYSDMKYFICKPKQFINSEITKRAMNNVIFVQSYFKQTGVDHEIINIDGTKNTIDATLKYIKEAKPDLIMLLITKDIGISDYILGAEEQKIIANDSKIPVMCINPPHSSKWGFSSGTTG